MGRHLGLFVGSPNIKSRAKRQNLPPGPQIHTARTMADGVKPECQAGGRWRTGHAEFPCDMVRPSRDSSPMKSPSGAPGAAWRREPPPQPRARMPRFVPVTILGIAAAAGLWWWNGRIVVVNPDPSGTNLIAFGDSLTAGEGVAAGSGEDYPARLAAAIGRPVLNRGARGDTSADALRRLETDVLAADPRIVMVLLGGNDLLRRRSMKECFDNIDEIVRRIQEKGALVVLVGFNGPILLDPGYGSGFRALARRRGCVFVPDVLSGLLGDRTRMFDQVHPNAKGYALVAERVEKALRPYLK